jgi:plasmid stabilization system protein ParE
MAVPVHFLPLARLELIEGRDWYAAKTVRLGDAFVSEVDRQVQRIAESPASFPVMIADIRRARLRRFPYSLFFRVVNDECFVLACFHASRDPRRWQERT